MKAFFVGLAFLMALLLLSGIGIFLFPIVIVMGLLLRVIIVISFVCLCIWLLGKFIVFIWERVIKK